MQDVASRVDQSCRHCASGRRCVYHTWSAAYIWLEVEQALNGIRQCSDGPKCWWCVNQYRRILNLMWHYGQRVYFESEE